jgi:6-phosphogluconate dehydrogenase
MPTISAALEARFLSARKEERVQCEAFYASKQVPRMSLCHVLKILFRGDFSRVLKVQQGFQ